MLILADEGSNVVSIQSETPLDKTCAGCKTRESDRLYQRCYDIIHPGHIDLLRRARQLGDVLVVAITAIARFDV